MEDKIEVNPVVTHAMPLEDTKGVFKLIDGGKYPRGDLFCRLGERKLLTSLTGAQLIN